MTPRPVALCLLFTTRDPAHAAALFAQSAQLSHTGACLNLGVMSANAKAVKWSQLVQLALTQ